MNKIDFSMQLYEKIFKNSKYYVVTNPNLIFNVGIINFKRKDKKAINIRFSQDYPLIIRQMKKPQKTTPWGGFFIYHNKRISKSMVFSA